MKKLLKKGKKSKESGEENIQEAKKGEGIVRSYGVIVNGRTTPQ